jgi:hypothetical protein
MSDTPATPEPYSPDKNLPPVQPPTLGFLVQLFVIPALIVGSIVMVWMLIDWLAHMGNEPGKEIEILASGSKGRWQAAHNLAKELAQDRDGKLRGNSEMASKLAAIFTKALDTPLPKGTGTQDTSERQETLQLRYYLARSLGLFTVDDGTTVLLRAAAPTDNTEELPVQVAALDSLGQLASVQHTPAKDAPESSLKPWEHEAAVRNALLAASQRPEVEIRERAAFHLGQFSDPAVTARLEQLTEDAELFTRFHAATSLAIQGNSKALPVLRELLEVTPTDMLPPEYRLSPEQIKDLDEAAQRKYENELTKQKAIADQKRLLVIRNSLDSLVKLKEKTPSVDLSSILPSVERLQADPHKPLATKAKEVIEALKK